MAMSATPFSPSVRPELVRLRGRAPALEALAAVLGGTQSLHTNSFDEALSLPSEEAATVALRTQQILAYESGVPMTVDPVGGAQAIEKDTLRIEQEARSLIEAIDAMGGAVRAIEAGFQTRAIEQSAYEHQMAVERGDRVIVGVNRFVDPDEEPTPAFAIDPGLEGTQATRVREFKASRDEPRARHSLQRLDEVARRDMNLVPAVIDAVKARATLGEISDALRRVFGSHDANA